MNKLDDIKRRYAELRCLFLANGISIKDFNERCRRLNDEFEEAMREMEDERSVNRR